MPIWLRNFTYSKLKEYYGKQNKQEDVIKKSIETMKAAGSTAKSDQRLIYKSPVQKPVN